MSPATWILGPDGMFEFGLHGILFFYPSSHDGFLTGVVDMRWYFASHDAGKRPRPAAPPM